MADHGATPCHPRDAGASQSELRVPSIREGQLSLSPQLFSAQHRGRPAGHTLPTANCRRLPFSFIVVALCAAQRSSRNAARFWAAFLFRTSCAVTSVIRWPLIISLTRSISRNPPEAIGESSTPLTPALLGFKRARGLRRRSAKSNRQCKSLQ